MSNVINLHVVEGTQEEQTEANKSVLEHIDRLKQRASELGSIEFATILINPDSTFAYCYSEESSVTMIGALDLLKDAIKHGMRECE